MRSSAKRRNCLFPGYNRKEKHLLVFICIVVAVCAMATSLQEVSDGNLKFTNSIYKILAEKEGNIFFSPISIEVILALTYLGARGKTAQEMATGLHLPSSEDSVKEGFQQLMTSLKGDGNFSLDIANRIFVEQTFSLKPDFVATAQKHFLSDALPVDFLKNHEPARLLINKWVEDKTNNKIRDLLAAGILTPETALVLVNAVYFKGNWATQFKAEATMAQKFFVTPADSVDVQMMRITTKSFGYAYREDLGCKVLEMPYVGNKLSLVILLPNEMDGLKSLEAKLADFDLKDVVSGLSRGQEVIVSLPKFKLEQLTDLNDVLKQMGLTTMFEDSADFSGMTDSMPGVKVSKVVHKAFIEVNEEGTEAAAATAVEWVLFSPRPPSHVFNADHPFTFLLRDGRSGAVLFAGRLSVV